jgi:uncharacterized protein YbgA (DUF1722 family)/uncharacterized protein YbbK (DUF523 family)
MPSVAGIESNTQRPTIGVSACLAGEKVRYDGTDKRDPWLVQTLGRYATLLPLCPEVAIGLGVPRPPIRLIGPPSARRVVGVEDAALDVTTALARYAARIATAHAGVDGYVFKSRSPSCGVWDVPVHPRGRGRGGYSAAFMARRPLLPVEEEDGLADPARRDNFIERVFAHRRWRDFLARGATAARLVAFHQAHKLALMAHGETRYRALGRLVAGAGHGALAARLTAYGAQFMAALAVPATRGRHANVLTHAAGFLKKSLDSGDRREIAEAIDAYRRGATHWLAPATLLTHHFRRWPCPWIAAQVYLTPAPAELALRSFG